MDYIEITLDIVKIAISIAAIVVAIKILRKKKATE